MELTNKAIVDRIDNLFLKFGRDVVASGGICSFITFNYNDEGVLVATLTPQPTEKSRLVAQETMETLISHVGELFDIKPENVTTPLIIGYLMLCTCVLYEEPTFKVAGEGYGGVSEASLKRTILTASLEQINEVILEPMYEKDSAKAGKLYGRVEKAIDLYFDELATIGYSEIILPTIEMKLKYDSSDITMKRKPPLAVEGGCIVPCSSFVGAVKAYKQIMPTVPLVKITYLKSNNQERVHYTSADYSTLMEIHHGNSNFVEQLIDQFNSFDLYSVLRGLWDIPDVSLASYAGNTMRKITVSRIKRIDVASAEEIADLKAYSLVDLTLVSGRFIAYLDGFDADTVNNFKVTFGLTADESLEDFVSNSDMLYTTEFRRNLHQLMIANPQLFIGYTGEPASNGEIGISSMGVNESVLDNFSIGEIDL